MRKNESDIETLFAQDVIIPEMVRNAKERALAEIRESEKKAPAKRRFLTGKAGVAAAVVLAVLMLGTATAAAATIFSRYEIYKAMEQYKIDYLYDVANSGGNLLYVKSRDFKKKEERRFSELERAYNNNEAYPKEELAIYKTAEGIDRLNGVFLEVTPQGEENILHFPKRTLKDEELLEIIDYHAKDSYAVTQKVKEFNETSEDYSGLFGGMTDSEVDSYYIMFHYSDSELPGGYERVNDAGTAHVDELSYEEESRYKGLEALFKSGQKKPASEIDIIQSPEDYDGTGVAFCDSNNRYYIQKEALSDEDILQIIKMRLKEKYVDMRVAEEVKSGKRDAVPVK